MKLIKFTEENAAELYRLDVNPLLILEDEVVAADDLLRMSRV